MSVVNIFTGNPVPQKIAALFTSPAPPKGETLTLTPADHLWYNYAVLTDKIPLSPQETEEKGDIEGKGFYRLNLEDGEAVAELAFLDTMGLLVTREDGVFVSPLAEVLYGPTGPFQMGIMSLADWEKVGPGSPTPAQRKEAIVPVANFMRRYVLPGRIWRAFVAREKLPATVGLATALDGELAGMSKMMEELGVVIGPAKATSVSVQTNSTPPASSSAGTAPPPSAPPASAEASAGTEIPLPSSAGAAPTPSTTPPAPAETVPLPSSAQSPAPSSTGPPAPSSTEPPAPSAPSE